MDLYVGLGVADGPAWHGRAEPWGMRSRPTYGAGGTDRLDQRKPIWTDANWPTSPPQVSRTEQVMKKVVHKKYGKIIENLKNYRQS